MPQKKADELSSDELRELHQFLTRTIGVDFDECVDSLEKMVALAPKVATDHPAAANILRRLNVAVKQLRELDAEAHSLSRAIKDELKSSRRPPATEH